MERPETGQDLEHVSRLALLGRRFLTLDNSFVCLDQDSAAASLPEPASLERLVDPSALALFLQHNLRGSRLPEERQQTVEWLRRRLTEGARRSKEVVPEIGLPLGVLYDEDLCPLYNDLLLVGAEGGFVVSLIELRSRPFSFKPDFHARLAPPGGEGPAAGPLLALGVNVKRALAFEDLPGYVRALMETGRLLERIQAAASDRGWGCVIVRDPRVAIELNRHLGFSTYYYSVMGVLRLIRR